MSTTVTYKGNTIGTADNSTVTLATAGMWMEADVAITDVSSGGETTTEFYAQDLDGYMVLDTQLSYIDTTRPFYVYKVVADGYETMIYKHNITQIMWEFDYNYNVYCNSSIANASNMSIVDGDTYRVTWDGDEYLLTPEYDSNNELYLGALLADDIPDRHPQYDFEIQHMNGVWYIWCSDDNEHTVNVEHLVE